VPIEPLTIMAAMAMGPLALSATIGPESRGVRDSRSKLMALLDGDVKIVDRVYRGWEGR